MVLALLLNGTVEHLQSTPFFHFSLCILQLHPAHASYDATPGKILFQHVNPEIGISVALEVLEWQFCESVQ